jgi:CelD/BcsL family acetyltransferase involved in cellulose biosynthesis
MTLSAEVKRPSALDTAERAAWLEFVGAQAPLRRAFFTPGFALACERAHGRAFVTVLCRAGRPVGFFPFQFKGAWQQAAGLAERIGGELSDNAGLVAEPGLLVTPDELLRHSRLGAAFITHLMEGQDAYGLPADQTRIGHLIEIEAGPDAVIARMEQTNKAFLQETRRRLRRVEREIGALDFTFSTTPSTGAVMDLIAEKRQQYGRTGMGDPFTDPAYLRLVRILVETPDFHCLPVLETLSAGGRVIARHFGLMYEGHLTYWFPVYDLALSKLSPGRLQLWHTIATAAGTGVRLIDLGEGDSQAKRDFSTRPLSLGWAAWHAATPRGLLARVCQALAWKFAR